MELTAPSTNAKIGARGSANHEIGRTCHQVGGVPTSERNVMDAAAQAALARLARALLRDREAAWTVGVTGAVAEFHHVEGDPPPDVETTATDGTLVSARGAVRVTLTGDALAVAFERPSRHPDAWTQEIAFCLEDGRAAMSGRTVLTELGPDRDAVRERDRDAVLFDLGIGASAIDFCIRTTDPDLIRVLRAAAGRSVIDDGGSWVEAIKRASPHRVCASRLGRIEIYQPIASSRRGVPLPDGPHTHLRPDLVRSSRPPEPVPLPRGWVAALTVYPASPVTDRSGRPRPFDARRHRAFQQILERYAPAGYMEEKILVSSAVLNGLSPARYPLAEDPVACLGVRIALRQLQRTHTDAPNLGDWLQAFDRSDVDDQPTL